MISSEQTPLPAVRNIASLTADRPAQSGKSKHLSSVLLRQASRQAWQHWRLILLAAVVFGVFATVLPGLAQDWWEKADYSHGFFVPLLSGYLIWKKRDELSESVHLPSSWGMVVMLGSLGLLFLGSLGAELFMTRIAFVGAIAALIIYFGGWKRLRTIAFPVAFLLFMIPLPAIIYNEIVFPLQLLASRFATSVLDLFNFFPVVREGNILVLPHSRLEVVEACSGIRSLMSLMALSVAYGYLGEKNRWIRVLLVSSMVPLAVVSNGFRVVGTAFMTYYFGSELADGFLHSFSGWMIFIVATSLLLWLHAIINLVRTRFADGKTAS